MPYDIILHFIRVEACAPPASIFRGIRMAQNITDGMNLLKINPRKIKVKGKSIISIAYSKQYI